MSRGLLSPFRRDFKRDFASGEGAALLRSKVLQVLMTEGTTPHSSGELPWRTGFGSGLHLLRHRRGDHILAELARVHIRDALSRWLPEVRLVSLDVRQDGSALIIRVSVQGRATGVELGEEVRL